MHPEDAASRVEPRWLRVAAAAAGAAGLTTVVCRYLLLPLDLPGPLAAVLTGGGIGLTVGGFQALRRARAAPPVGVASYALTSAGACALVVAAFLLLRPAPPEKTLAAVELPGLTVSLPPWQVEKSAGDWFNGFHQLADPAGLGRFVKLEWSSGLPLDTAHFRAAIEQGGALTTRAARASQVCGRTAQTLEVDAPGGGKECLASHWYVEGRNHSLFAFIHSRTGSSRAVHDAILASVVCLPAPQGLEPTFPRFAPPEGARRGESSPETLFYELADGSALALTVGTPGRQAYDLFRSKAELRITMIEAGLGIPSAQIRLGEEAQEESTSDGGAHSVFAGEVANPEGKPERLLVGAFACDTPARTFFGFFVSSSPEQVAAGRALLKQVRCP